MSEEDLTEWHEDQQRKERAAPMDSVTIRRDGPWLKVEGYAKDRKVGFKVTQDEFEKMDNPMIQDYLIGIRERLDERT